MCVNMVSHLFTSCCCPNQTEVVCFSSSVIIRNAPRKIKLAGDLNLSNQPETRQTLQNPDIFPVQDTRHIWRYPKLPKYCIIKALKIIVRGSTDMWEGILNKQACPWHLEKVNSGSQRATVSPESRNAERIWKSQIKEIDSLRNTC